MAKGSGAGRGAGPEGSYVRYGKNGRAQRVKTGGYHWSEEAEEAFFKALGESCNVRASAASVGFTTFTVYRQRRMRPDFAARYAAVLDEGYSRLELALLERALDCVGAVEAVDDAQEAERPIAKMTVEQAMNVLRAHRNEVRGDGNRGPGQRRGPPPLDAVRASIERKVRAIRASGGGAFDGERGDSNG